MRTCLPLYISGSSLVHILTLTTLLVLTAFFPSAFSAQETVYQLFKSAERDSQLEEIVYLTVGIELANAGYVTVKTVENSVYTLPIEYTQDQGTVGFHFFLYRTGDNASPLSEVSASMKVDYTLDSEIGKCVRELLAKAHLDILPALDMEIDGLFASNNPPITEATQNDEIAPIVEPVSAVAETVFPRYVFSVGAGGTFFFGEMAEYFTNGVTGMLHVGTMLKAKVGLFTPGARITVTRVNNASGIEGGTLLVSTLGLDAQYGTARGKFRVSAVASVGAAILTLMNDTGNRSKTVPYVDSGFFTRLKIGKGYSVGTDVRFLAIFDPDIIMMGAVPLLFVDKEF